MTHEGFGKIIVLGEHAVVYGEPALAAALPAGCRVQLHNLAPGTDACVRIAGSVFSLEDRAHLICAAVRCALEAFGLQHQHVRVEIEFALAAGAGVGSSAAMAIALLRAAAHAAGSRVQLGDLQPHAEKIERLFHGNPSGLDAWMAEHGGAGLFERGRGLTAVSSARDLVWLVANTGVARSTHQQVSFVRERRERLGAPIHSLLTAMGDLARDGARCVERGDVRRLGELMDVNQGLLAAVGVSHPALEDLIAAARRAGALGAKLTGAGGGGSIIALCEDPLHAQRVSKQLGRAATIVTLRATPVRTAEGGAF